MADVQTDAHSSEARADELLRSLRGAIVWEAEAAAVRLSFISEAAAAILGFPASQWEPDEGLLKKYIHPEDWGRFLEALYRAAAEGSVATCEHRMIKFDGSTLWAQTTIQRSSRSNGMLLLAGLTVDISRIKEKELSLREKEAHSRLLIENLRDYGVFMLALDGSVASWSPGAQRLKGYRAHEAVGSRISRFFPAEEIEKRTPERLIEQALLNGSATHEGWLVRKGGARFWSLVTLSVVEDENGNLRGLSNVARDLTERKKAEDALRESEERLRLLIDSLQDYGVFMMSPEGLVASWSPGAERVKGYRAEEILGKSIVTFFPAEEVAKGTPKQLMQRAAAEGRAEYEGWIVRKGGIPFWASVILSAVMDSEGHLRGFSNVTRDLTDRMRAERAMSFLSDVGTVLAGSLDYHTTLDRVAQLATRELAQACVVEMLVGKTLQPVTVAHVERDKEPLVRKAVRSMASESRMERGVARVAQTGRPELLADISGASSIGEALGLEDSNMLRELGAQSYMCVPLTARSKTFGALVFLAAPGRHYGSDDLLLAEELARRAALAIDNARLYEQAQTAVRMREEVLAVVSHDLRNPLSTIRGGPLSSSPRQTGPSSKP